MSSIYLKCETGRITALLGRNGQGKSCLMKIIYGSLQCEKSVRIDNVAYYKAFRRPDLLRYLPQFHFIPRHLSLKRVFSDFAVDYIPFAERFPEYASHYKSSIGNLSGGGHRLVEVYIILKSRSRFVMLDEPFTHLSPLQIEKVKELLIEEKSNKGLLITDHMYHHVLEVYDSLYILVDGQTQLSRSTEDIERLGYARV